MNSMKPILQFYLIICLTIFYGCSTNNLKVDISTIHVPIHFYNLDSIEFQTTTISELKNDLLKGDYNHDEIINYQFNYCLGIGNISDDSSYIRLKMFTEDPYFKRVNQSVKQQLYPLLNTFNREITDGLKRLKFHQKDIHLPTRIIYMNSAFSSSIFSTEHEIGVSLERYLSDTTKVIQELPSEPFYDWVTKKFNQRFLVRDVILGWITTHIVPIENGNLAEKMIQYGKALYLTKAALPDEKDALIMRYDEEQFKWARENEINFWDYLVKQKLLYTTNERDQSNLLNDGPYTTGLPEQGPDRLGQFTGYQMVLNFMKEHPKMKVEELMKLPAIEIIKEYNIK